MDFTLRLSKSKIDDALTDGDVEDISVFAKLVRDIAVVHLQCTVAKGRESAKDLWLIQNRWFISCKIP